MGSSVGVSKAHTVEELRDAIDHALTYDEWVVVEEAVVGREIEVAVLGGTAPQASGAGEIVPGAEFYDYEDKYVTDGAQLLIPAPLTAEQTDEVRALAVRVFEVLRGDGLARVDFFFEEGGRGFLCNEANTMPGFTPISMYPKLWQAAGVELPGAHRPARRAGARTPRPAPPQHQALTAWAPWAWPGNAVTAPGRRGGRPAARPAGGATRPSRASTRRCAAPRARWRCR